MNKSELITAIADKSGLNKKDSENMLQAFEDVVSEELANGGKIQLVGFGAFNVTERKERTGRSPQTGEEITIPASKAVRFKAGKNLKDLVNTEPEEDKKNKKKK